VPIAGATFQLSRAEKTLKASKNEWCNQVASLAMIQTESFAAECRFYSYFEKFSAITDMTNPQVPKVASQCRLDKASSMNNFFSNYRTMTAADRNLRATCYPKYTETSASLPLTNGMPLLSVDL